VPDLIAKLKAWNTPYKRKGLFYIKTTFLKQFLELIFFGNNLNTSKFSLS
jgi:hypothetical protein